MILGDKCPVACRLGIEQHLAGIDFALGHRWACVHMNINCALHIKRAHSYIAPFV